MKKGFWHILGLVWIVTIACYCARREEEQNSVQIVEAINQVDAHPHPEDDWQTAAVGMAIYGGGQVRTGTDSSARLELMEGVVRLWAETLFTVKEYTTRQERSLTTLFLQEGRLWAHLTATQPHEFSVETASAVAAVRDTRFSVQVGSDQTTLVSVAQGEVVVIAQGQSVTVTVGLQATVKPGQPPEPPEPMSADEIALWTTEGDTPELVALVPTVPVSEPTPTPTQVPTPTSTPTPTPVPTSTSTPLPTPTQTPTPTPTPEPPPAGPQDVAFEARDGQVLSATYHPPLACPSALTVVYFPWVRGDRGDWQEFAAWLPEGFAHGAFSITARGCEGGCGTPWDLAGWLLDYVAAMDAAKELACAGQSQLVTVGSSVGADGAIYACAQDTRCVAALAFSPNGWLDVPYVDEVARMVEQGKHVWAVSGQEETGATRLDRPEWSSYYREIVIPGTMHGNELFGSSEQTIQDFLECATLSFALEKCR